MNESQLSLLLGQYPYLIDEKLVSFKLVERTYPDGTRPDLLFYKQDPCEVVVIELKRDVIDHNAVNQIYGYIQKEKVYHQDCNIYGILIGKKISDFAVKLLQQLREKIDVKLIGKDIPEKVKFCTKCRKANRHDVQICKYCGHQKFFD